jgi:DNA-binding NtrC family response regulator
MSAAGASGELGISGGVTAMGEILVVESDASLREVLSDYLRDEHYTVSAVGTVEEAFEVLSNSDYALVITPMHLPRGSGEEQGLEVLRRARARDVVTQVIVLTAPEDSMKDARAALRAGAFDYIELESDGSQPLELLLEPVQRALEHGGLIFSERQSVQELGAVGEVLSGLTGQLELCMAKLERARSAVVISRHAEEARDRFRSPPDREPE